MQQLILNMSETYEEYLVDESKYSGYADSISFPENEQDIRAILKEMKKKSIQITIQGGKTGIAGGAVPKGGHIMNLSRMNQVKDSMVLPDGTGRITVEAGINLMDLKREINSRFRKEALFWPPDPTETSATVGGIIATNARGLCRLTYGETKQYIEKITMINENGDSVSMKENEVKELPSGWEIPALDTIVGKEGISGIISEVTLKVIPKPQSMWGITFFFKTDDDAGTFIEQMKINETPGKQANIVAVEYMDTRAIELIQQRKETMSKIKELPDVDEGVTSLVYVEIHGEEEEIEFIAEQLMEHALSCNSDPEEAWAVSGENEIDKMHAFRHGVAESVNICIEEVRRDNPELTKLGTDMSISKKPFSKVLDCIKKGLAEAELDGCVFGHAADNHLHVNILPRTLEEYERGIVLVRAWAEQVHREEGILVGEHGIGKLKQKILHNLIPEKYINQCIEIKQHLNPSQNLNEGNIFH